MKALLLVGFFLFPPQDEEKVVELLEKVRVRLKKADVISIKARESLNMDGAAVGSIDWEVMLKRPNQGRVFQDWGGGIGLLDVWDGKTYWWYAEPYEKYSEKDQKGVPRIEGIDWVDLFFTEVQPWLSGKTGFGKVKVFPGKVGGRDCQIISIIDFYKERLWVDSEGRVLKSEKYCEVDGSKFLRTFTYEEVDFSPAWKKSDFSFEPHLWAENITPGPSLRPDEHLLQAGSEAPDFEGLDLDGRPVKLSDFKGKSVLLAFWWGEESEGLSPLQKIFDEYKDRGVIVLAVNIMDPAEQIRDHFQKEKFTFRPLRLDKDNWKAVRAAWIKGTLPTYVIDKDGKIVTGAEGWREAEKLKIRAALEKLLPEK